MADDSDAVQAGEQRGLSRRAALKAGVATGVGIAAWSGASITSLGGTPAYAVACSQSVFVSLGSECRNTDSSSCAPPVEGFRYHTLTPSLSGFSIVNNVGEGTCCNAVSPTPQLVWDHTVWPNLACVVHLKAWSNGEGNCHQDEGPPPGGHRVIDHSFSGGSPSGPASGGSDGFVNIPLNCEGITNKPSGFNYSIFATCATPGAPSDCFQSP
jgi:hypothetical protein